MSDVQDSRANLVSNNAYGGGGAGGGGAGGDMNAFYNEVGLSRFVSFIGSSNTRS